MVDNGEDISYWNESAEKMFGYSQEEAIGEKLHTLIIPDRFREEHLQGFKRFRESGKGAIIGKIIEVEAVNKKGIEFPIELSLSAVKLKERWNAIGIIRDITQRKLLESQLVQAQKLESIGQLAAGIAHEINTPTQYVGDNTRFLQDTFSDFCKLIDKFRELHKACGNGGATDNLIREIDLAEKEADVEYLVEEIPKAIQQSLEGIERIAKIVRAMKDFSHPGMDEKSPIDINRAIESTVTVARNEWKYVADMETDYDASLPLIPCFPGEFNQAILNIIINAAHAIADVVGDGSKRKGIITIGTRHVGEWAEIRIQDTGTGIPEAIRSKIFDPFFTTKEVGKGTGQGLSIAHSIVAKKHGGAITFETEVGKGTTFIIRIPIESEHHER